MDTPLPGLQTVARRVLKSLAGLAIDAAAWSIARVCHAYPRVEDRREIHRLRMRLIDYQFRNAELEDEVANYKAMHELQHGPTVHLSLTPEQLHVQRRDIN